MAQAPFVLTPTLIALALDYAGINSQARGYIADQVAVRYPVDGVLFRYPVFPIEEAFTVHDTTASRLGRLKEIVSTAQEVSGACIDYGIMEKVPHRDEAAARIASIPFSLQARAARNVVDKLQLAREVRVAAFTMSSTNYASGYLTDLSSGTKWSDYQNSDPVSLVKVARRNMLIPGNVGVCSEAVMDTLSRHPKIATAIGGSYTTGRFVAPEEVAKIMGLDKIIVGNTLKQTSNSGQTLTTSQIWSDSFAIHYQGPMSPDGGGLDFNSPNFLSTYQWGGIVSGTLNFQPGEMGLWGGVGVITGESLVEKQNSPYAGYLFQSVL